jgi:hypothetical protein
MIEPSSPCISRALSRESLWIAPPSPSGPPPDFESGTLVLSPLSATVPPPYSPLYEMVGDEPTLPAGFFNDKSAPPPYASADPEPVATSLLNREMANHSQSQSQNQSQAQVVGFTAQPPRQSLPRLARRTPTRRLSMNVRPLVGLRSAVRAPASAAPVPASAISFVLVAANGFRSAVPELIHSPASRASVDSQSESDSDYDSESSEYSDDDGPDPKWCGRVAIWSAATQRLARRGSMGDIGETGLAHRGMSATF